MSLHEETDAELKAKLSSGELGDKKTAVAEAVLRHRRAERTQEWHQKARLDGRIGRLHWDLQLWLWSIPPAAKSDVSYS